MYQHTGSLLLGILIHASMMASMFILGPATIREFRCSFSALDSVPRCRSPLQHVKRYARYHGGEPARELLIARRRYERHAATGWSRDRVLDLANDSRCMRRTPLPSPNERRLGTRHSGSC